MMFHFFLFVNHSLQSHVIWEFICMNSLRALKSFSRDDFNFFLLAIWGQDHVKVNNRLGVLRATQVVSEFQLRICASVGFCL